MTDEISITDDPDAIDWQRLADVMARAPLVARRPAELERAWRNSFAAAFAWRGGMLVGGARAVSDGVFYATIFDVAVDPAWQGVGVGRRLVESLLARLPVEKVFLTAVPGKEGFYGRLGFLRQTNAMGRYADTVRDGAIARGILLADAGLASPRPFAVSQ